MAVLAPGRLGEPPFVGGRNARTSEAVEGGRPTSSAPRPRRRPPSPPRTRIREPFARVASDGRASKALPSSGGRGHRGGDSLPGTVLAARRRSWSSDGTPIPSAGRRVARVRRPARETRKAFSPTIGSHPDPRSTPSPRPAPNNAPPVLSDAATPRSGEPDGREDSKPPRPRAPARSDPPNEHRTWPRLASAPRGSEPRVTPDHSGDPDGRASSSQSAARGAPTAAVVCAPAPGVDAAACHAVAVARGPGPGKRGAREGGRQSVRPREAGQIRLLAEGRPPARP